MSSLCRYPRIALFSALLLISLSVFSTIEAPIQAQPRAIPTLYLSAIEVDLTEGTGAGATFAQFLVELSEPAAVDITFDWEAYDIDATAPEDYVTISANDTTIPAGSTTMIIGPEIVRDAMFEDDETVGVRITEVVNATPDQPLPYAAELDLINDDSIPGVTITGSSPTTNEGTPFPPSIPSCTFQLDLLIELSNPTEELVDVTLTASDGTATTADNDYQLPPLSTPPTSVITLAAGQTEQLVTYFSVCDSVVEPDEIFTVTITGAVNATFGGADPVEFTILNDDGLPAELLTDGSFENLPAPRTGLSPAWVVENGTGDKVKCEKSGEDFAFEGGCVFQFKGSATENSAVSQTIKRKKIEEAYCPWDSETRSPFALFFSGVSRGSETSKTGYRISYWDASKKERVIGKGRIMVSANWTAWTTDPLIMETQPVKIRVTLYNKSKSGKTQHDDVSLLCGKTDHFRAAAPTAAAILPPPAAPDGFRTGN